METRPSALYDRLGGADGVWRLLHGFYDRILRDQRLAHFFRDVPVGGLIRMQEEFFSAALDGPQVYGGRRLTEVHAGRGIMAGHFSLFCQHLLETLEEHGAQAADVRDVVHRVAVLKNDITGESYGGRAGRGSTG
jgi:hemoglobin